MLMYTIGCIGDFCDWTCWRDPTPEAQKPHGFSILFDALVRSQHAVLYMCSFAIATFFAFAIAEASIAITKHHDIVVHRSMKVFMIFGVFMTCFLQIVVVSIDQTPLLRVVQGPWAAKDDNVVQNLLLALGVQAACWLLYLGWTWCICKVYKRYEDGRYGARMYKRLFNWSREEAAASWETSHGEKWSSRDVEEAVEKKA